MVGRRFLFWIAQRVLIRYTLRHYYYVVSARFDNAGVSVSGKVVYPSSDGADDVEVNY
jgi:hypothetical protein